MMSKRGKFYLKPNINKHGDISNITKGEPEETGSDGGYESDDH